MDDSLTDEQNRAALESRDLASEAGPDESGDDWPPEPEADDLPPFGSWRYNGDRTWSFVDDAGKVWETIRRPSSWLHDDPDGGYTEGPEPDGSRYVPGVGWIVTSR